AQAVPPLIRLSSVTNEELARLAIKALGHLKARPEVAIPALTNCLNSPSLFVRRDSVHSLARFGKQTIPILVTKLMDQDEFVRRAATNCLELLEHESLTNAPAQ